jgi:hypothetical protein
VSCPAEIPPPARVLHCCSPRSVAIRYLIFITGPRIFALQLSVAASCRLRLKLGRCPCSFPGACGMASCGSFFLRSASVSAQTRFRNEALHPPLVSIRLVRPLRDRSSGAEAPRARRDAGSSDLFQSGSSGWLGQTLVPRLTRDGHDVVGMDPTPSRGTEEIGSVADRDLVRATIRNLRSTGSFTPAPCTNGISRAARGRSSCRSTYKARSTCSKGRSRRVRRLIALSSHRRLP